MLTGFAKVFGAPLNDPLRGVRARGIEKLGVETLDGSARVCLEASISFAAFQLLLILPASRVEPLYIYGAGQLAKKYV